LGDPGVDGKIILRWIFRKWDSGYGMDPAGSLSGTCACGNKPSDFIKCGKIID
jgi:hypothetical protein